VTNGTHEGEYISIDQAAERLRVSVRQVHNHISAGRIRSRKQGRRRYLVAEDVYRLADELDTDNREVHSSSAIVPADEQLPSGVQYLQTELTKVYSYAGQLEEQLKTRITHEEATALRERLAAAEARAKALEEQVEHYRKPLWRRLLGV
jgi:excisionase family DNA binding protein